MPELKIYESSEEEENAEMASFKRSSIVVASSKSKV
jgi:hypothetical protein